MARRSQPKDEILKDLVGTALADMPGLDDDTRTVAVERIIDALRPVVGEAAERRRNEGVLRASFKDGFMFGKNAQRASPWHIAIWKASQTYTRLRRAQAGDESVIAHAAAFARYNFDD